MSYTPTEWVTGDTIIAEKLNNMELGIVTNEDVITDILPYTLEAHCSINPQTMSIVSDTFVLDVGDMNDALTNYEKSRMIIHLIVTGTEYEYAKMVLFPTANTRENVALSTNEEVSYSTVLPLPNNNIGFASVVYDFDQEKFFPAIVKLQASI
jgi:hypothetical protein